MQTLTKTEVKVSRFIAYGLTEMEIADKMFVSHHTVHTHTKNIRKKTGAQSKVDIARMYILGLPEAVDVMRGFKRFTITMVCLAIHFFTIFYDADSEMRKPRNGKRISRTFKTRRNETI